MDMCIDTDTGGMAARSIPCSKASVVNNYEDNSWAFVVIT
jgi:hypothetical protein